MTTRITKKETKPNKDIQVWLLKGILHQIHSSNNNNNTLILKIKISVEELKRKGQLLLRSNW